MKKLLFILFIFTSLVSCKKSESDFNQARYSIDSLLKDNPDFHAINNENRENFNTQNLHHIKKLKFLWTV